MMQTLFDNYSLETLPKDAFAMSTLPAGMARPAQVFVPYLPDESDEARVAACEIIRNSGLEPVPHLSARRLVSVEALDHLLAALRERAQVTSLFLIAGDLAEPAGPFADSLSVIETGLIEKHGFSDVGIAGHPDGHPDVAEDVLWQAMRDKVDALAARGLGTQVVTQFSFDAAQVVRWLGAVRAHGVTVPVRIGIPGPAGVRTLLRYAARCGVAASAGVVAKYGLSLGRLIGNAGPDKFLGDLHKGLQGIDGGPVMLHVFPFGGFDPFAIWMTKSGVLAA
jgi:methylenetetrahydrofolate reductase (NADPH)